MLAKYVARRFLASLIVVLGVTAITLALMKTTSGSYVPGIDLDPALRLEDIARLRAQLGLDEPPQVWYATWLWNVIHGDFGRSMIDGSRVTDHIFERLPNTIELTATAIVIGVLVAVPLGVIGALRRGSKADHGLTVVSVAGFAVPQFWMGLMLILIFSVTLEQHGLPWLPSSGAFSAFQGGDFLDRLQHLILPATVLSFFYTSTWSRFIRSSMLEVLSQDYIRTARAKGMSPSRVAELDMPAAGIETGAARPAQSYWNESWERLRGNRLGGAAGLLIVVLALIAVMAPLLSAVLTHAQPQTIDLSSTFARPGAGGHLLGADELGRDTLTRLIWGALVSLGVAFLTVAMSLTVGTAVGMMAGYYGGWLDDVLMRFVDMVLAIPAIFLFILMSILIRPNAITLAAIVASVGWGSVARLVRGEVLSVKQRDFILATRSIGARDSRLMLRHLLPNVLPVLIVAASLGVGQIILVEAALDFLGLGIQPPTPSWGNMLTNAQSYFFRSGSLVAFPGITIFITVLASNIFGNAVRDAFDPRLKS